MQELLLPPHTEKWSQPYLQPKIEHRNASHSRRNVTNRIEKHNMSIHTKTYLQQVRLEVLQLHSSHLVEQSVVL